MANTHSLEEIINRPGTYFNPQTEVLIIVDDSADLDGEIFNMEEFEGSDWILISEESPIEEHVRDELLERFQSRHSPSANGVMEADDEEEFDGFEVEDPEEQ